MIFQNIYFHNVEQMERLDNKWKLSRIPDNIRVLLNEGIANNTAYFASGVELRFKMKEDEVDLYLSCDLAKEANALNIFFGCFQGGWEYSIKYIGCEMTKIHIKKPGNMKKLIELAKEHNLPFSSEVVRVVLPYGHIYFHKLEGEIETPSEDEMPKDRYLAYGSSITHGSLALLQPYTYAFRIAERFNMDYINLGFAGTAHLEEEMAKYIVSRKDWKFASVEMGINMIGESFTDDLFEERVDKFTEILSKDSRPVFATDIFVTNSDDQEKTSRFRAIVEKYAKDRLIYTKALDILNNPLHISADAVHPSRLGVEDIVNNWGNVMSKVIL